MRTGTDMRAAFKRSFRAGTARAAAAIVLAAAVTSCGELQRQGEGSSYLIVNALEAARGSEPSSFAGNLPSDVVTVVNDVPTVFNDMGRVRMVLAMKDPGGVDSPTKPTTANYVTITQYHVRFIRADGRNTPGVDVPYGFDGGMAMTVGASEAVGSFNLVRNIAKNEAPLRALTVNGLILSTVAEVTFYGHDQTGREVSAVATISVDFGNFGDKTS